MSTKSKQEAEFKSSVYVLFCFPEVLTIVVFRMEH